MKFTYKQIFKFEKAILCNFLKISVLLCSCILYFHGTVELLDAANAAEQHKSCQEQDLFKTINSIFQRNNGHFALGGVMSIKLNQFVKQISENHDLLMAIKYILSNLHELEKQLVVLEYLYKKESSNTPEIAVDVQEPGSEAQNSANESEAEALPVENFEITKAKSEIEKLLSVTCAAHLILFIAFREHFAKIKLPIMISKSTVINTIKYVVGNSLNQRKIPFTGSFYDTALSKLLKEDKKEIEEFQHTFAKNFAIDRKSGQYKFVLKLIAESLAFCGDVYAEQKLTDVFAKVVVSEESIAKAFPKAVLETKGLLGLISV